MLKPIAYYKEKKLTWIFANYLHVVQLFVIDLEDIEKVGLGQILSQLINRMNVGYIIISIE